MEKKQIQEKLLSEYPDIRAFLLNGQFDKIDPEALRMDLFRMISDLQDCRSDYLTQTLTRGTFFSFLRQSIVELFPQCEHLNDMSHARASVLLRKIGNEVEDKSLRVLYGDVGYLNLANSFSHAYGDKLLCIIIDTLRIHFLFRQYGNDCIGRLGGDEFALLLHDMENDLVRKAFVSFTKALSTCDVTDSLPIFTEMNLVPVFDCAAASLKEASILSARIIESGASGGEECFETLLNVFIALADKRALVSKGFEHIQLMIALSNGWLSGNFERYAKLMPYVKKGCFGVGFVQKLLFMRKARTADIEDFENAILLYVNDAIKSHSRGDAYETMIVDQAITFWQPVVK